MCSPRIIEVLKAYYHELDLAQNVSTFLHSSLQESSGTFILMKMDEADHRGGSGPSAHQLESFSFMQLMDNTNPERG
jgi:hypothetical protein